MAEKQDQKGDTGATGPPDDTAPDAQADPKADSDPKPADQSGATFSQSEVDKRVTDAMTKREATVRAEMRATQDAKDEQAEQERLEKQGEFEGLYKDLKAKSAASELKAATVHELSERNLGSFEALFTAPMGDMDAKTTAMDALNARIDDEVTKRVAGRLNGGASAPPSNLTPGEPTDSHGMKSEQLQARLKESGVNLAELNIPGIR